MTLVLSALVSTRTDAALLEELLDAFEAAGIEEKDLQWVVYRTTSTTVVLVRAPLQARSATAAMPEVSWVPFAGAAVNISDNRVRFVEPSPRSGSAAVRATEIVSAWQNGLWSPPDLEPAVQDQGAAEVAQKAPDLSSRYARIKGARSRPSAAEEFGAVFAGAVPSTGPVDFG